jgi:hypothetical protein
VEGAQFRVHNLRTIIEQFIHNRGWALLDTKDGNTYRRFGDFVTAAKPWGLGTDYEKFRNLIASEIDEREFDRWTTNEPKTENGRPPKQDKPAIEWHVSNTSRSRQLRAINRAPPVIQKLYDDDLIAVDLAAQFGPKDETRKEDRQARSDALQRRVEALRIFRQDLSPRLLKREINRAAREILELETATPLELAKKAFLKLNAQEHRQFLTWAKDAREKP